MDVKDIKRLLEAVADAEVNEFTLETGDYKLTLKRGSAPVLEAVPAAVPAPAAAPAAAPSAAPAPAPEASKSNLAEVVAPIVGTFYAAPAPDAADYVKVGDRVEAGKVLCIIEAMKLMNEIEAEVSGKVTEILVKNEEPVEYGQVLFRMEPA